MSQSLSPLGVRKKLAEVVRGVKFVNGIREIKQNGSVDEGKAA